MPEPIEPSMSSNTEDLRKEVTAAIHDNHKVFSAAIGIYPNVPPFVDFLVDFIVQHESTLKAEYEEKVRQARVEELESLRTLALASAPYSMWLHRIGERLAQLNTPKNGEQDNE